MAGANLTEEGNKFLDHWEAPVLFLYDDQGKVYPPKMWMPGTKVKGYLTLGFGHLCSQAEIKKYTGKTISLKEAQELRQVDLAEAAAEVDKRFKNLKPHERDALIILAFNIPEALDGSPGKYLRKGDFPKAFAAWAEYVMVTNQQTKKKEPARGLFRRRIGEILLFVYGRAIWHEEAK